MLISLVEYAQAHGIDPATARQKILRGNLKAIKIGRNWVIEDSEPYIDQRRSGNKMKKYAVNEENIVDWYGDASSEDIETKQSEGWTKEEIEDLARGWEKSVAELMECVHEC